MKVCLFILLIVLTIISCGDRNLADSGGGAGTMIIECQLEPAPAAKTAVLKPTTKADISVYDSQNNPIVNKKSLTVSGTSITGTLQVKAGSGYSVELFCYDKDNTVTHSGTASNVRVVANKETRVTIILKPAIPDTPTASGPTGNVTTGTTYTISWEAVSRAKSYTIEEATNSNFSNATIKTINVISESYTKDIAETYYYHVRTTNATGNSSWSNTVTVTVEPIPQKITMVYIPSGSFTMGDDFGYSDSRPTHKVTLDSFEMSTTEITQGQYKYIMGNNPSGPNSNWIGDTHPVNYISWEMAIIFCNLLSDKNGFEKCYNEINWTCDYTKNGYRLPTEAEWEYACRAGTTTKFYTGDTESDLARAGWYASSSSTKIHPVGEKEANKWGLFDMHGNVWEWCNDLYSEKYYLDSPSKNPIGPESSTLRVARGGGWGTSAGVCGSAYRDRYTQDYTDSYSGFRIVRGSFIPGYIIKYTLSLSVNQSGWGTTNPSVGSYEYKEGTTVTIIATPTAGYYFVNWTGDVKDVNTTQTTVEITEDKTVIANFEKIPSISLVKILAGNFMMGTSIEYYEESQHKVTLDSFEMSIYEITQSQYKWVMGTNPSKYKGNNNLPVDSVSWEDAVLFSNRLSELLGFEKCYNERTWECYFSKNGYRLPTEAEWEYACRAGTTTEYYSGDEISDLQKVAWFRDNNIDDKSHLVGTKQSNSWGLYDLHGNLWEWCNDWYDEKYYEISTEYNPIGPTDGFYRVVRGGSFWETPMGCTSYHRFRLRPAGTDSKGYVVGLRIVRRP